MSKNKETQELKLQLNNIEVSNLNPTLKQATFSIMDLGVSGNNQSVEKSTVDNAMKKLNHLPILAKYLPVSESGAKDDNFTDHEPYENTDRDGNDFIDTDTLVIGHFISEGRYEEIDGIQVIVADAVLYADKYPNQIALLEELLEAGVKINTSCEYYYSKNTSEIIDGVEVVSGDIIFVGHTILGSNPNGEGGEIKGSYDTSKMISMNKKIEWNKCLNSAIEKQKILNTKENKEGEDMKIFEKIMNALSHDDIRQKIYSGLESILSFNEWHDGYVFEVYDNTFIFKMWMGDGYDDVKYWEFGYTKDETSVTINPDSKKEVIRDWASIEGQLEISQNKVDKINKELIVESHNKKQLESKLEEATDKIISMNSKLEKLSDIEEQYNKSEREKSLNARRSEFEPKFKKVNALEVFNGEEVQKMIENSIDDESIISSLNSMIVDLIPEIKEDAELEKSENAKKEDLISGLTKTVNNLLPDSKEDILSKYIIEN